MDAFTPAERLRANTIMQRASQVAVSLDLRTRTRMFSYDAPAVAIYARGDVYVGDVNLDSVTGAPKPLSNRGHTKSDRKVLEAFRSALITSLAQTPIA